MAKSKTQEQLIEAVCDYKKGWTNLENTSKKLLELSDLNPDVAKERCVKKR